MSEEIAIKVQDLTKVYKLYDSPFQRMKEALNPLGRKYHRDFYALNEVSFEVKKGETVGIIGQNGAGKSTLLKIITGVISPTSGTVDVNGNISALLELGAGFNPDLTGVENVYFSGTLMGFNREEMAAKLDDILAFADIGEYVQQPVKTYSSGMFVRLAFAVSIHIDPQILIIDEALSVGDVRFQARCFEKIRSMRDNGVTILHVTHSMQTFQNACDYGILLENGKIYAQGEPKNISVIYYKLQREHEQAYQVLHRQKQLDACQAPLELPVEKEDFPSVPEAEESRQEAAEQREETAPSFTYTQSESGEHRFGSRTAEITEFRIYNDEGEESLSLETGKKFKVVVKIKFHGSVDNPAVGIMVRNVQGMNLFGLHTYHDKRMNLGTKKKGDIMTVSFESAMLLNPGKYIFNVGIAEHDSDISYVNIDSRNNVAELDVFGKAFSYGMIHHDATITVQ